MIDAGYGNGGSSEQFAFPLLGGGKIHFEDAQRRKWIAVREGIETRAEDHVLRHAALHRFGQLVFNKAAAGRHVGAEIARHLFHGAVQVAREARPNEPNGKGIVQNRRRVGQLVRGAANSHAQSGFAGSAGLHISSLA